MRYDYEDVVVAVQFLQLAHCLRCQICIKAKREIIQSIGRLP